VKGAGNEDDADKQRGGCGEEHSFHNRLPDDLS
jgi:hypothetical protein